MRERLHQTCPEEIAAAVAGQGNRRKRKRVQSGIPTAMRQFLSWVVNDELPPSYQYPYVAPGCVYSDYQQDN